MLSRTSTPLIEAFLIVEQPRQRLSHWSHALGPLDEGRAPALAGVAAYYDPSTDHALLALSYDELALGSARLGFVVEVALLAEIGMIQPAELSEADRRRFLGERLARCTINVADRRVVGALSQLVRRIREHRQPAARATVGPQGTIDDPVLLVTPKSTRDNIMPMQADDAVPLVRSVQSDLRPTLDEIPAIVEPPRRPAKLAIKGRTTTPHVIARRPNAHRAATVQMEPIEQQRLAREGARPAAVEPERAQPASAAESVRGPQTMIYARYLRSGRWVPVRVGALSLKGAVLMSGALPRVQERIELALLYGVHRAIVRGIVSKVSTTAEAAVTGAPSFSVGLELETVARRQLTGLLTAARAAKVTIKPPPPRQGRRYPVAWPVCLGTVRGAVRGEALDVSREGMFVRPTNALALDANLSFSAVLDDGDAPISGRAKVVRHIDEGQAQDCGLAPGYGLHIVDMGRTDYLRWHDFLVRIEKRAEKHVLVGAHPGRVVQLQAGLAALGYVVSSGTDPDKLVQLAGSDGRPVDACLIDAGWSGWLESEMSARAVPCVTSRGDMREARLALDRLLLVM